MGNEEKRKFGLRWRDRKKAASSAVDYLQMEAVPEGWVYCVQIALAVDETNDVTNLLFGVLDGNTFKPIYNKNSATKAIYWDWTGELFLHPGEVFAVKFADATGNDLLEALAWGYRQRI